MVFLTKHWFEIISLCISIFILIGTYFSNKKIEKMKLELQESLNKKSIEFENIQEKKVERISLFIDGFTNYLVESSEKKLEELEKVMKGYDSKKEFMTLANTLMLFCEDNAVYSYEKFRETTVKLILEREEIAEFCQGYYKANKNMTEKILKKEKFIPPELNVRLSRMTQIDKEMRDAYSEFVLALRKSIGINTKLTNGKYMEIVMPKKKRAFWLFFNCQNLQ